jgi:branched-chain amino acid transport system permease protein
VAVGQGKLIMLLFTLVLMGLLTYLVMFTKRGRAMRAVSHDFNASSLMGIDVNQIITFTFILGSSLAGAGAMMYATFQPGTKIDAFLGLAPGLKAFVAAVLGGIGNIPGAVLGGLLMGVAENMVIWLGYDNYRDAVAFLILIVVLLLRPGGLLGSAKVEKV